MKLEDHSVGELRKLLSSVKEKVSIKEYYKMKKGELIKAMRAHPALSFDESGSDSVKIMVKADVIAKTTPKKAKAVKKKAEGPKNTKNVTKAELTAMINKKNAKDTKNVTKAELTEMINKKNKDLKKTNAKKTHKMPDGGEMTGETHTAKSKPVKAKKAKKPRSEKEIAADKARMAKVRASKKK